MDWFLEEVVYAREIYSYQVITDTTERLLNQYVADAQASPERSEALVAAFNGAFWLWYQLTRDSDNPDRDADGTRFMDLIPEFPEQ